MEFSKILLVVVLIELHLAQIHEMFVLDNKEYIVHVDARGVVPAITAVTLYSCFIVENFVTTNETLFNVCVGFVRPRVWMAV